MGYKFNPFTGNLDDAGAGGTPGGSTTQIQFNDGGSFGGDVDLTWNKTANVMTVAGDLTLDDGVAGPVTTLQTITPTQNNTISLPNATGTVALVAGSSGQLVYNNAGANAGVSTFTADSSGRLTNSASSASGFPVKLWNGTIFAGATPHVLVQPTGASTPTSTNAWSANGTALAVNTAAGFTGNLLDLQVNGTRQFRLGSNGEIFGGGNSSILMGTDITITNPNSTRPVNIVGYLNVTSSIGIGQINGQTLNSADLILHRDAANTLAQRNGTSAQVFRVYNTYTSATNYELGKSAWERNTSDASTNGFISGTTLTVDSGTGIAAGQIVTGTGVTPGTKIVSGSGTTWTVSQSQTVGTTGARVAMVFGAPALRVGTEKGSGGGTARALELQTDNTTRVTIAADGSKATFTGDVDLASAKVYKIDNTQVVAARVTGWGAPSGTATRTTFATSTVTTEELAQRVKALIDDLTTHGLIGT